MVDRYAPVMDLPQLRALAGAIALTLIVLVILAAVLGSGDESPLVGTVLIAAIGAVSIGAIAWTRQLPVRPGDAAAYGKAAAVKLAVAEAPGLIGFALAISLGPWWLAVVGAGFSFVGFALAWPSEADRERHELLFLV